MQPKVKDMVLEGTKLFPGDMRDLPDTTRGRVMATVALNKGGKFLKKLWCASVGSITR